MTPVKEVMALSVFRTTQAFRDSLYPVRLRAGVSIERSGATSQGWLERRAAFLSSVRVHGRARETAELRAVLLLLLLLIIATDKPPIELIELIELTGA